MGLGNDLKEIENRIERLLLDLNLVVEDKILDWCKVKDRTRLPSPASDRECNQTNQKFLIQKIDFYSKLVNEFEKYEALIARSRQLIEELNAKLDELASAKSRPIDEIAINYRVCSTTIETTIAKILDEIRDINNRLRDHNYSEELHANEILNELRRLKQRNEEQYGYLVESFSKDLLKQIEIYRTKCEHCQKIGDLRNLAYEVRDLNTTSVHKLEHLNINDVLLHNKLLGNLEALIKQIDEKCNILIANGLKDDEKRVRITTELTQKKIVEEIDGKGERSSQISEYNFKDLSNVNPFYQTTTTNSTTTNTVTKQSDGDTQLAKPCQSDFGQQFNLSQENLGNRQEKPLAHVNKKVKHETQLKEAAPETGDHEPEPEEVVQPRRKESYEIEAEKERERLEAEFKRNQEKIEQELNNERKRLEDEAQTQRLKLEEDARKERARIEEEMRKEKERFEIERQIEKDNDLIRGLDAQMDKLTEQISSNNSEQTIDDLRNVLNKLKQLCIQAKYVKDTQLNDKNKINDFEVKLNELVGQILAMLENKIANDLDRKNFDLSRIDDLQTTTVNLDENINRTEYAFNLVTNYVHCQKAFTETVNWIEDSKDKINFLPYETIENLIDQYKQFTVDCDTMKGKLDETSDKLNSGLKYSSIVRTPYADNLEELRSEYTEKCKEIIDDFSTELKGKASDIEQQAKECESFNEFRQVNQELNKLKKNNEPVLDKVRQESNLEIVSELSKIDNQLDELTNKLENILDAKAVELVHYSEFVLEPSDLKVEFDNLKDKMDHYDRLQNEIEHYKDLLIDNDIFLENLRKKFDEVNLKPVEQAIRSCRTYADNITEQIDKLQNSLKDLNKNLAELGCVQELKCTQAVDELNKLKSDYERKLDQLIGELVGLVRNNLEELKSNAKDELKEVELDLVNLDQLNGRFEAKVNKLNLNENPDVTQMQNDLNDYKQQLNAKYDDLKEQERLEEEERIRKLEEEKRLREAEDLRLKQLEQERLERLEQERLEQERLEQERLEQERLEQERLEQERQEQERLEQKRLEQERLEQERLEQERLEQERLEQERLEQERLEQERLKQEKKLREAEEDLRLKKEEEERLKDLENERLLAESDFSSAANLSKIDVKDENDNLNDKKLKKLVNSSNKNQWEEPIAIVQVQKMPQKAKAKLTNTSRMYSVEHYSELEDSIDGEPIIELIDSDNEQSMQSGSSVLEEIRQMIRELKDGQQPDSSSLANLVSELNNIKNICLAVGDVRNSKENRNNGLDERLEMINRQLNDIFNAIKDNLSTCIPNLQDNLSEDKKGPKYRSEQDLIDSINLYTEVVTEFDKFDNLVNANNDFINEIKNQLRRIDHKPLDHKLIDYRDLLDKINSQINSVSNEMSSMNENLKDLKYKENLDARLTLDELEKLRKLCEDHIENSIEDLYISYIPKLNNLDNVLNQTTRSDELESILERMVELKAEINEKVDRLDLNASPLIKNLLDLVERLKNKIEDKIVKQSGANAEQNKDVKDNLLNEQLEQAMAKQNKQQDQVTREEIKFVLKRPLQLSDAMEFSVQRTPDSQHTERQAIFNHHHNQYEDQENALLQHTPPVLSDLTSQLNQMSKEADQQLDDVLSKLRRLKDTLTGNRKLSYDQIRHKMNSLIELISAIQEINEKKPDPTKLQKVTTELNQVVDCLAKVTNEYIRKVCEQENTRSNSLFDNLPTKNDDLDQLMDNLRPSFESMTEYRKFEKLTENNQEKLDALNRVIDQLSNLPINEKVKNLKVHF